MNALASIDQKTLTSPLFISPISDYSICFLIKIQGLCDNVFENSDQTMTTPCKKKTKYQILCTSSLLIPVVLRGLCCILKSIPSKKNYCHICLSDKLRILRQLYNQWNNSGICKRSEL